MRVELQHLRRIGSENGSNDGSPPSSVPFSYFQSDDERLAHIHHKKSPPIDDKAYESDESSNIQQMFKNYKSEALLLNGGCAKPNSESAKAETVETKESRFRLNPYTKN